MFIESYLPKVLKWRLTSWGCYSKFLTTSSKYKELKSRPFRWTNLKCVCNVYIMECNVYIYMYMYMYIHFSQFSHLRNWNKLILTFLPIKLLMKFAETFTTQDWRLAIRSGLSLGDWQSVHHRGDHRSSRTSVWFSVLPERVSSHEQPQARVRPCTALTV